MSDFLPFSSLVIIINKIPMTESMVGLNGHFLNQETLKSIVLTLMGSSETLVYILIKNDLAFAF